MPTAPEPSFALRTLAAQAGMTVGVIQRLIERGELPAHKVGRQWRVRQSDWDAFTRSTERRAAPAPEPPAPADVIVAVAAAAPALHREQLDLIASIIAAAKTRP